MLWIAVRPLGSLPNTPAFLALRTLYFKMK